MTTILYYPKQTLRQRRLLEPPIRGCDHCHRMLYTRAGRPYLFTYSEIRRKGELNIEGVFCTLTCMRMFHS